MNLRLSRRSAILTVALGITVGRHCLSAPATDRQVDPAIYFAHIRRVIDTLRISGAPLPVVQESELQRLAETATPDDVRRAEQLLSEYVLLQLRIDEQGLIETTSGSASSELVEQGWRSFLVRVENPRSIIMTLGFDPNTLFGSVIPEGDLATRLNLATDENYLVRAKLAQPSDLENRWLGYRFYTGAPLGPGLTGRSIEYQVLQLYSRDRGRKTAYLEALPIGSPFVLAYGQRRGIEVSFDCLPSRDLLLAIKDFDGAGTTASLIIRDNFGRIYPAPAHRIEPDFDFQPQVYRADGESIRLPAGEYEFEAWRGPEYLRQTRHLVMAESGTEAQLTVRLERWINPAALGWFSGDIHLHASGCSHYDVPTMGVTPETMLRHVRGEGLHIGSVLTWGPGYYHQKQFFTGQVHKPTNELPYRSLQKANNTSWQPKHTPRDDDSLVRLDVEVSGFPSSHSGHLVLLNLKDQDFPGASRLEEWPTWNLPILQWARAQGAIVGYAHSGLMVDSTDLPNYQLPAFELVGANEFLVDVAHDAVDFLAGTSCHPAAELNLWYHALNCGFRTVMVGETDFPCLWERAGNGRTYVGLAQPPFGDSGFSEWAEGIKRGRVYFGDGRSHLLDYRINDHDIGNGDLALGKPGKVTVAARVAAQLEEEPIPPVDEWRRPAYSFWHLERARIGASRKVMLEVVVNGQVAVAQEIVADGKVRDFAIELDVAHSSWVALRILPSVHSAPIHILVEGHAVRASRRSAQWCLECIDVLWREKAHRIRDSEQQHAQAAYEVARQVFRRIVRECLYD